MLSEMRAVPLEVLCRLNCGTEGVGRKGRFPDRGAAIEIFMTAFDPLLGRFALFLSRPSSRDSHIIATPLS